MTKYSNQLSPPSLEKGEYEQVPKASTSHKDNDRNDTLMDGMSLVKDYRVNPIGGDEWDSAFTPLDEQRPHSVCQFCNTVCTIV